MPLNARGVPRFLPTLTEVVQPSGPVSPAGSGAPDALSPASPAQGEDAASGTFAGPPGVDAGALSESVLASVEPRLRGAMEERVHQVLLGMVDVQAERIAGALLAEMQPMLRQWIEDSVARALRAP